MNKVISSRITEAREARAMSMGDLADSIGITRQSISKYERGINRPTPEMTYSIASTLKFPVDFFYKEEMGDSSANSALFFRSKAGIAKKLKTASKYQVKWIHDIKSQLDKYIDFLDPALPTIDVNYEDLSNPDIEELALQVRNQWGLGDAPIGDLIGTLENSGALVASFSITNFCSFKGIEAFSAWKSGVPYILYNSKQKTAVRIRFSLTHELGHLIMHSSVTDEEVTKKEIVDFADNQADRFAAAFLLPATSFPKDIRSTSLTSLEIIKRKWGVSFSTIIRRCETLKLLSENQLNYMKRQMTIKKYWRKEPLDDVLCVKGPEMLKDSVALLIDSNLFTPSSFVSEMAFPSKDLKELCSLPDDFFTDDSERHKPFLKIIHSK